MNTPKNLYSPVSEVVDYANTVSANSQRLRGHDMVENRETLSL